MWSIQNYAKNCMLYYSFSWSTNVLMYPPMQKKKTSLWACWFLQPSLLPDFLEKPTSVLLHPHHSLVSTLQSGFTQHCNDTVLLKVSSGLPATQLNGFSSVCIPFPFLCNLSTIEQPFLDSASSLEDATFCHNCEYGRITLI